MMEINVPDDLLRSQRSVSAESFPPYRRDRMDIYGYESCIRNPSTLERKATYVIMKVNCNPDFDW